MARFVVFGATGFTGSRVVRDLVAAGHSVRGVSRSAEGVATLEAAGAEAFRGDPNDRESIRGAGTDAEYVIQCTSGMLTPAADGGERPYASQIRNVLDEVAGPTLRKYVWTGTTAVYGNQPGKRLTEADAVAPVNAMGEATAEMERVIAAVAAERGVPAVVLRVPGIVVPERVQAWQGVKEGTFSIPGDGLAVVPLIHVDDLAHICVRAALDGRAGEAYNLSIENPDSFGAWYDLVADKLGVARPKRVPVENLPPQARAFTPIHMDVDASKLRTELQVSLRYPTLEALADSVAIANR